MCFNSISIHSFYSFLAFDSIHLFNSFSSSPHSLRSCSLRLYDRIGEGLCGWFEKYLRKSLRKSLRSMRKYRLENIRIYKNIQNIQNINNNFKSAQSTDQFELNSFWKYGFLKFSKGLDFWICIFVFWVCVVLSKLLFLMRLSDSVSFYEDVNIF